MICLRERPIAIVQHFEALTKPYQRVVFLSAMSGSQPPGTITIRRWRGGLPGTQEIQDRVSEAVTGVISLDNLLVVGEYFGIWPAEVIIVDVSPGPEAAGDTLTPAVRAVLPDIIDAVRRAALEPLPALDPLVELRGNQLGDEIGLWARIQK